MFTHCAQSIKKAELVVLIISNKSNRVDIYCCGTLVEKRRTRNGRNGRAYLESELDLGLMPKTVFSLELVEVVELVLAVAVDVDDEPLTSFALPC